MKFISPILLFLVVSASHANGQDICNANLDFAIKEVSKSYFEVSLQSSQAITNAKVQLYDLYTGKVVQEKLIPNGLAQQQVVFTKVRPSHYTILVKYDGCSKVKSIGGIEGIKIGEI